MKLFPYLMLQMVTKRIAIGLKGHLYFKFSERFALVVGIYLMTNKNTTQSYNLIKSVKEFLIHKNKYLRATSIWALSQSSFAITKIFISKLLDYFDNEDELVIRSALNAVNTISKSYECRLFIPKIISTISKNIPSFPLNLISYLYEIIISLSKTFTEEFKEIENVQGILLVLIYKFHSSSFSEVILILPVLKEITNSSFNIIYEMKIDLITRSFEILNFQIKMHYTKNENLDYDLIDLCIQLIIINMEKLPNFSKLILDSHSIIPFILTMVFLDKEKQSYHSYLALICHSISLGLREIDINFDKICLNLINFLYFPEISISDNNNLAIGINSSWGLSLLVMKYKNMIYPYLDSIAQTSIAMITRDRINKALAQNISVLLGRMCLIYPGRMSCYLDSFMKQFCISMRSTDDCKEKQEAFDGLCHSLAHNPSGLYNHLGFFLDAICFYDDAPQNLKDKFFFIVKRYISSSKWSSSLKCLPDRLKDELLSRFII